MVNPLAPYLDPLPPATSWRFLSLKSPPLLLLSAQLYDEQRRWVLWLPVALGIGVLWAFSWPVAVNPKIPAAGAIAAACIAIALRRRPLGALVVIGLGLIAAGFALAKQDIAQPRSPLLTQPRTETLTAQVLSSEIKKRPRLLLAFEDTTIGRALITPHRQQSPMPQPGDWIRVSLRLFPPAQAVAPASYDPARRAYFKGIGAQGYALQPARIIPAPENAQPQASSMRLFFARLRLRIGRQILHHQPHDRGAFLAALATGDRSALSRHAVTRLQVSGLAHLLAISGLHVGLVAGLFYLLIRRLIALIPALALSGDSRIPACIIACAAALAYLLLTGGSVPTQRAVVMFTLATAALLLKRRIITLHTTALAATIIILTAPHSLAGPSFQLSFAAVIALVTLYESWIPRSKGPRPRPTIRLLRAARALFLTSLVATLATTPLTIYYFTRITPYSPLANLLVIPPFSLVLLPGLLISLPLMAIGWAKPLLSLLGAVTQILFDLLDAINALPAANSEIAAPSAWALCIFAGGGLWLCLWKKPWRWFGLAGPAVLIAALATTQAPDVLIAGHNQIFALKTEEKTLLFSENPKNIWYSSIWRKITGSTETAPIFQKQTPKSPAPKQRPAVCSPQGCLFAPKDHRALFVARKPMALSELQKLCARVHLFISFSRQNLRESCPQTSWLGPEELADRGSLALRVKKHKIVVRASRNPEHPWPWQTIPNGQSSPNGQTIPKPRAAGEKTPHPPSSIRTE